MSFNIYDWLQFAQAHYCCINSYVIHHLQEWEVRFCPLTHPASLWCVGESVSSPKFKADHFCCQDILGAAWRCRARYEAAWLGQTVVVRLELQKLSWYLFVNCSDIQEGWAESCFHSYMPLCNEVVVHCQNPLIHTEEPDHCCPSEGSQTGDCLTIKMHRMTSDEGTEGFIPISFLPLSFHWTYQCFSFISE